MKKNQSKTVVITGASSGIGEACARAFAQEGANLVLLARRKDRLERLASELAAQSDVKIFEIDVRDAGSIDAWAKSNSDLLAQVDVLVNNAGLALGREPIYSENPRDWEVMIDTNIKGLLYMTHAVLPFMMTRKTGHIVNLGSVAGHWTYPHGAVYAATKYAVRALNESLRLDLHGTGIRVSSISPGMVETEFSEVRFRGDEAKAKAVYQGMKPLTPADIAECVVWSCNRPPHVNIQEMIVFPTDQASVTLVNRK
jgi:3-hydroxy acid dehydrogenase/malonic semialdehyde reductase